MVIRRKRGREFLHKGMVRWTSWWRNAKHRLGDGFLKAECFAGFQHAWGYYRSGPGCCSYLKHTSSADRAFSFLSDSLPVFCLLFGHRISFQPFGLASIQESFASGYDLTLDRYDVRSIMVQLPGKGDLFEGEGFAETVE